MVKKILFIGFLVFAFTGCELEDIAIPFNFEKNAPAWLKIKIDSLMNNPYAYGMQVIRYKWHDKYIYHITSPYNSCMYCDMYDDTGKIFTFSTNEMLLDFLTNKIDATLIWEWKS